MSPGWNPQRLLHAWAWTLPACPNQLAPCFQQSSPSDVLPFSVRGELSGDAVDLIHVSEFRSLLNLQALHFAITSALKAFCDLVIPLGIAMAVVTSPFNTHATVLYCFSSFTWLQHIMETRVKCCFFQFFTCRNVWGTVGPRAPSSVAGFGRHEQQPSLWHYLVRQNIILLQISYNWTNPLQMQYPPSPPCSHAPSAGRVGC